MSIYSLLQKLIKFALAFCVTNCKFVAQKAKGGVELPIMILVFNT